MSQRLGTKFETCDDVIKNAEDFYSMQGYSLSIKIYRKNKYVCSCYDHGGKYRDKYNIPTEARQRKTSTH